ncbi:hypothetical protein T10_4014 [Trichinella papuae]|uniref:Uncharacterized protein n=1 Tax=Trichinella papuae TaxID=268474 RepID=A0A0V1MRX9_9BILA|nr:hypothetical protein T10_4014 [Trichinella papuae]
MFELIERKESDRFSVGLSFSLVCASVAAAAAAADYCSLAQLSLADDDRTNNWTALGLDALLNSNFTAASWLDISHSERKGRANTAATTYSIDTLRTILQYTSSSSSSSFLL